MTENLNDGPESPSENEVTERPQVLEAMAVYSADGQADDASGNDAGLAQNDPEAEELSEGDRMPHGPS